MTRFGYIIIWITLHTFGYSEVHHVLSGVYSGEEPNQAIFKELSEIGIKTIISVDGMKPDIHSAQEIGAKYIHLPIGYDGISSERANQLAYAFKSLPRPLYIHCHHGVHRGPSALAYALIATGEINQTVALELLETLGTSKEYSGLWNAVKTATNNLPISRTTLPEVTEVNGLASQMALIDEFYDELKLLQKNNWQPLSRYPDLISKQSALMLYEAFRELNRSNVTEITSHPDLPKLFTETETIASHLHEVLTSPSSSPEERNNAFLTLKKDCRQCHQSYRN